MIAAGVFGLPARANTIYNLSYTTPPGATTPGTVNGFIETNTPPQPFGVLAPANFVDWDIKLTVGATLTAELTGPLSGNNSTLGCCSSTAPVTASATDLTFAFGSGFTGGLFDFGIAPGTRLCYSDSITVNCAGLGIGIGWQISTGPTTSDSTGIGPPADNVIATAAATATPLPATLPLFATGLGALGLLGWRRKRKAQAA